MHLSVLIKNRFFNYLENINSENLGFYCSFFLHLLILLFVIGLPNFFDPKPISIPTIIPIEIINVTEFDTFIPKKNKIPVSIENKKKVKEKKFNSSNNQEIKKIEIKDKSEILKEKKFNSSNNQEIKKIEIKDKSENLKEKKFNSSNNQEIKKIEINNQPKKINDEITKKIIPKEKIFIREKKETSIKLEKKKIEVDLRKVESLPSKIIKPKLKPKPNPVIENQKTKKDIDVAIKPKPRQKPEFNIASMLKDLRNQQSSSKTIDKIKKEKTKEVIESAEDKFPPQNVTLSINEIDLLRQQLSSCWIAPAGAVIKKGMLVKISTKLKKNRRIYENSVRIVDTNIPKSNSFYGPITESAMRTLLNPECIPLKLPEDKYQLWKNLTITFDYSIMKGY